MKRFGALLFLIFSFLFSHAQMPTWAVTVYDSVYVGLKNYISSTNGEASSIIQAKDGGYLIGGIGHLYSYNNYICVAKLDSSGKLQWSSNIDNDNEYFGNLPQCNSVVQAQNGNYVIVGYTGGYYGAGGGDIGMAQIDSVGNLLWSKTIGGIQNDEGYSVVSTKDSGYAITGITASYGAGGYDVYVIKTNSAGIIQWTKTIGGTGDDEGFCIIQTSDRGYAITGETNSYGAGGYDVYVIKLTSAGNLQWTKTIGGRKNDWGNSIIQSRDGGYAITGVTYSFGDSINGDVYLVKLDSAGNLQWAKTVGGAEPVIGKSIVQTGIGDYVIAGYTNPAFGLSYYADEYFIRLDSLGNLKRTLFYGDSLFGASFGESMIETKKGGFAIGGYTSATNQYGEDNYYVLLLDSAGNNCDTNGSGGVSNSGGITDSGGSITSSDSGRGGNWSNGGRNRSGAVVYSCGNNSGNLSVLPLEVNPACHNFPNGSITLYPNGGTPPYTYTWSPNVSSSDSATGLSAGYYTITITDSHNNDITVIVSLFSSSSPLTFRTNIINSSCKGNNDGSAGIDSVSGTPPYTYLWSTGSTNETDKGLSAGTYSITVSDSCGNVATAAIDIAQTPDFTVFSNITNFPCYNSNDGSATVNVSGGIPPFTYLWNDAGNQTTATAIGLSAGIYKVSVSDFCGGVETVSVSITQSPVFGVTILSVNNAPTNISCIGGTITAGIDIPAINFSYEATVQHFTVPEGVTTITLTIAGAEGGDVIDRGGAQNMDSLGGNGASFTGTCTVNPGEVLSVVVGQQGGNGDLAGGGGGASWVYDSNRVLYSPSGDSGLFAVAAGGGGGAYNYQPYYGGFYPGGAGGINLVTNATTIGSLGSDTGGTGGNGGKTLDRGGGGLAAASGGGGGWLSNGEGGRRPWAVGGKDETNGFSADSGNSGGWGGFGGGGGGGYGGDNAYRGGSGGGGGGYNGAGSGDLGGGGGGSYFIDTLPVVHQSQKGNGFVSIAYILTKSNPDYSYLWSNGETTLDATGLTAGTYTITVTDNDGCTATASAVISQPTVLINSSGISVYPNPTAGLFTITDIVPGQEVSVYNSLGQNISNFKAYNSTMQINLPGKANGIYLIRITNEGCKTEERKVVKTQ